MQKTVSLLMLLMLSILAAACGNDAPSKTPAAEGTATAPTVGGPFTEAEFLKFLRTLSTIPGLSAQGQTAPTGDVLAARVRTAVREAGWNVERFTYIYGHAVSMLTLDQVERTAGRMKRQLQGLPEEQRQAMGQVMRGELDKQRKAIRTEVDAMVPASEQAVLKAHMDELRTALGMVAE